MNTDYIAHENQQRHMLVNMLEAAQITIGFWIAFFTLFLHKIDAEHD